MKIKERNLKQLIEFIRSSKFDFDMNDPMCETRCASQGCGSAGCIGGHAAVLWADVRLMDTSTDEAYVATNTKTKDGKRTREWTFDEVKLARKLGLDDDELNDLTFPQGMHYYDATKDQALRVLDHLLHTGTVDWSVSGVQRS